MRLYGWSYLQLCELPVGYFAVLDDMLRTEKQRNDAARAKANTRKASPPRARRRR